MRDLSLAAVERVMYGLEYMLDTDRDGMRRYVPRPGGHQPPGQTVLLDMRRGVIAEEDLRQALEERGESLARVDVELDQLG